MKRSLIRSFVRAIALVLGLVVYSNAWAVDPVAVWYGDFSNANLTQNGWTLNLNGNDISQDNSTITIDRSVGVTVTKENSATFSGGFTVLFKYSNLNLSLAARQVLVASKVTDANSTIINNRTGAEINTSGKSCGIWGGASWNTKGTYNTMTSAQTSGVLAFSYHSADAYVTGGGSRLYYINGVTRATVLDAGGLGTNNDVNYYLGCSIGGPVAAVTGNNPTSAATGMKITGIAFFQGLLSEAEMCAYFWPSEIITVSENTSVSALNTLIANVDADCSKLMFTVEDGVKINVDAAFSTTIPVTIVSEGSITLEAASQPDASYFANVDFSGVQGALLRSWLTPGVVGFNFNADGYRSDNGTTTTDACNDTALALEIGTWFKSARDANGTSTGLFADGLSKLTWTSANLYAEKKNITSGTFIQGYLDDGSGGAKITLSGVPYETYDVIIYCSTDVSSKSFKAKTVNGTVYTWDATAGQTTTTGSDTATWGLASAAAGKAVYGANTLRINGLSGALSINGGTNGNGARGCISAIQIMPAGTSTAPEMTVGAAGQTTQATWTGATWNVATAPTAGNVIINVSGNVELSIDETVALSAITVNGEGSLKIIPDQANGVTFTASSISSSVPLIFANDGIGIDTISAPVTYLYAAHSIISSAYGSTYTAGAGQQNSPVTISHNGGTVTLQGATYYLGESYNGTSTTVTFHDATAQYANSCGIGMATYIVEGSSSISAQGLVLSQGANSRTAVMTVKDTSSINVTGTSDVDSNRASIMFGHWNGPSTFTIQDSATFTAASQILVGKTANNHTINLNGGSFTAKGIKASASASGTNRLNMNGGLAILGTSGITSYSSTTIGVNVAGNSEIRASAATLPISQPVTIAANAVLSLTKVDAVTETTVSLTGSVSGSGGISVGPGVTLNLGVTRPENEITVDADGALAVVLANKVDQPILKVAAEPSSVILYDIDGTTVLSGADVTYDSEAGTITVHPPVNTWNVSSDLNFDTAGNWSYGLPESTQDTAIKVTGDAALTIAGTYEAATLTVSGSGVVEFSGAGSFTVGTLYLNGGATLASNSKIVATSIVLDGGTVLRLKDTTESAPISGAGAVETYGNVEFTAENTFTGGLTVKSGSLVSSTKTGVSGQIFGKNNYGQAIANLSTITVEDGGSLDLANSDGACYAITIAGKGVFDNGVYKGALFNSGAEIPYNHRQMASLTLAADAMVRAESLNNGWGIVNSSHDASVLALNGHTLTVSGAGYFPIVNANTASGTQTTGTLIADGVTLGLVSTASNLTGVDVIAKGCATIKLETAPSALGSLTLKPSATGTTASNWNLPSGCVPTLDTSNVDPAGLSVGDTLTLFTAPQATTLTAETIAVKAGGRYTTTISGNTVTATVKALAPFLHYDFNGEASAAGAKASDSTYAISGLGGNWPATNVNGRNGTAALIKNGNTPFWNSLSANVSAIHAGEMSVVALIRPIAIDGTVRTIWNLGQAGGDGMALVAKNASTLALVSWTGGGAGADIVSVSNIQELAGKWHFVAVVASASGTTLVVDGNEVSTTTCVPQGMTQAGQFGAVHGNGSSKGYYGASDDGFRLDDWRVYDVALTAEEVASIKKQLLPGTIFLVY